MNSIDIYPFLSSNIDTFYYCSKDNRDEKHIEYMDVPEEKCVNFDKATQAYVNQMGCSKDGAASADSLVRGKAGNPILIEFKNGKLIGKNSQDKKINIREKMCNSVLILEAILDEKWTDMSRTMEFVLVYNEEKNPKDISKDPITSMHEHMNNAAAGTKNTNLGSRNIRFGLERYVKLYYKNIYTVTEKEFTEAVKAGMFCL